jgi:hypothetical protein
MTLPADADLNAAIDALPASKGGWVPVLDDDMQVLGIVSGAEVIRGWQDAMRRSSARLTGAASRTTVVEGTIGAGSPLAGTPVDGPRLPRGSAVVSTVRGGMLVPPDATQRFEPGDSVTVLTRVGDADEVRTALGSQPHAEPHPGPGPGPGPGSTEGRRQG